MLLLAPAPALLVFLHLRLGARPASDALLVAAAAAVATDVRVVHGLGKAAAGKEARQMRS